MSQHVTGGVSPDSYPNASLPGNLDSVPLDDTTYGQPWLEIDKNHDLENHVTLLLPPRVIFVIQTRGLLQRGGQEK